MEHVGYVKPIIVRELENGELQILGGEHRRLSAINLKMPEIEVINLGVIGDERAKQITLLDNERYGEDNTEELVELLSGLDIVELATFLPISNEDFDDILSTGYDSIDLDELDVDDDEESPTPEVPTTGPTHRVMRFKVSIADSERLTEFLEKVMSTQGFKDSDAITNAVDALIHTIKDSW